MKEITEIETTLQRINNGVYGICITCGDAIKAALLDTFSESPKCLECSEDKQKIC